MICWILKFLKNRGRGWVVSPHEAESLLDAHRGRVTPRGWVKQKASGPAGAWRLGACPCPLCLVCFVCFVSLVCAGCVTCAGCVCHERGRVGVVCVV